MIYTYALQMDVPAGRKVILDDYNIDRIATELARIIVCNGFMHTDENGVYINVSITDNNGDSND